MRPVLRIHSPFHLRKICVKRNIPLYCYQNLENGGLSELFNIPENFSVQIVIIIVATVLFMASALSGLDKGVKTLSNLNMVLAAALVV